MNNIVFCDQRCKNVNITRCNDCYYLKLQNKKDPEDCAFINKPETLQTLLI